MNKEQSYTTKKERHCHKPTLCGAVACVVASVLAFLKQGSSLKQYKYCFSDLTAEVYAKMAHNGLRYE